MGAINWIEIRENSTRNNKIIKSYIIWWELNVKEKYCVTSKYILSSPLIFRRSLVHISTWKHHALINIDATNSVRNPLSRWKKRRYISLNIFWTFWSNQTTNVVETFLGNEGTSFEAEAASARRWIPLGTRRLVFSYIPHNENRIPAIRGGRQRWKVVQRTD